MKETTIIPIFPLDGAIFFPETNLPLNIFEDRYISMVDYALSKDRLIGMIQNKNSSELYNIGCVGKISSFSETDDGRYVITLLGLDYFEIKKEIKESHKFRIVEAKFNKTNLDNISISKETKQNLIEKYKKFLENNNLKFEIGVLDKIDATELVKFIAMTSPFSKEDKQMLIETFNLNNLTNILLTLFDYYLKNTQENRLVN